MRSIIRKYFSKVPDFDPTDPEFVADPYPTFDQLRIHNPVYQSKSGAWVLTRYEDVLQSLTDPRLGNAPSQYATVHPKNRDRYVCANVASNILPFLDSPEHDVLRRLVIQAYRETMKNSELDMEELATEILKQNTRAGRMEVLGDFATPLSFGVMCRLFDLPEEDIPKLENWCHYFFYLFMPIPSEEVLNKTEQALTAFREYLHSKLEERRNSGRTDLLSSLLTAEKDGQKLTDEQVVDNAMLLFADGIENVDKGIGNAVLCLLQNPDQWNLLKEYPGLIPSAAEECLRYESPAQYIGRIAKEDFSIEGQLIKKNMPVLLVLGAANRDPQVFDNPNDFTIERQPNKHLSFGRAKHSCVGGGLVKQEMVASLNVLVAHAPNMRLETKMPQWDNRPGHRWVSGVEVKGL